MRDGFGLPVDRLRSHADALGEATSASRSIQLSTDAYGQVCRFVAHGLNALSEPITGSLDAARRAVSGLADELRAAVEEQRARDEEAADQFRSLVDGLDEE